MPCGMWDDVREVGERDPIDKQLRRQGACRWRRARESEEGERAPEYLELPVKMDKLRRIEIICARSQS